MQDYMIHKTTVVSKKKKKSSTAGIKSAICFAIIEVVSEMYDSLTSCNQKYYR